jgi:hypothetical protein
MQKNRRILLYIILSVTILITITYATAQQSHPWGEVSLPPGKWPNLHADLLDTYDITEIFARDFWTNGTGNIIYYSSGNVGINTSTPASTLTVQGSGPFGGISTTDGGSGAIMLRSAGIGYFSDSVGIGTSTPTEKLQVVGGNVRADGFCIGSDPCIAAWTSGLGGSGNTNYIPRWSASDTLANSAIFQFGSNIGIGTTNPTADLHITQGGEVRLESSNVGIQFIDTSAGDDDFRLGLSSGVLYLEVDTDDDGSFDDGRVLHIESGGNVGVGTTTPGVKLDVDGVARSIVGGQEFYMVPRGAIVMWAGTLASIPSGWRLCDGISGTPDLRNSFIYGVNTGEDPGATGGTLTHSHDVDPPSGGSHRHSVNPPAKYTESTNTYWSAEVGFPGSDNIPSKTHTHRIDFASINSNYVSVNIDSFLSDPTGALPPYYKLAFICRL